MALTEIKNYLALSDRLSTAGQPTEEQLCEVGKQFDVVINLGLLDPRYCLADEAGLARSLKLAYHHIPVDFQAPTLSDLKTFFTRMDEAAQQKLFVHCAANYRVTTFVGLFAQARWRWSREQADQLIRQWWQPNEVWSAFVTAARTELQLK